MNRLLLAVLLTLAAACGGSNSPVAPSTTSGVTVTVASTGVSPLSTRADASSRRLTVLRRLAEEGR